MFWESLTITLNSYLSDHLHVVCVFLGVFIFALVDYLPAIVLLFKQKYEIPVDQPLYNNYSIIIPIYKNLAYLPNANHFRRYREKLTLCTTVYETSEFMEGLYSFAKKNKFSVVQVDSEQTSLAIFKEALKKINTSYSIRIDADSYTNDDFGRLIGFIRQNDWDIASVTVVPDEKQEETLAVQIQKHEYRNSMRYRYLFPFMISGACVVGKTDSLIKIMANHTMLFYGEDLENGILARALDMKIGYAPFSIYTVVPSTMKDLYVQRRNSWVLGGFRLAVVNFWNNFSHLWMFFYDTVLVYILLPVRVYSLLVMPQLFIFSIAVSWLQLLLFNFRYAGLYMLILPIWGTMQSTFLPFLSILRYIKNGLNTHNWGIIKRYSWRSIVGYVCVLSFSILVALSIPVMSNIFITKSLLKEDIVDANNIVHAEELTASDKYVPTFVEYGPPVSILISKLQINEFIRPGYIPVEDFGRISISNEYFAIANNSDYPASDNSRLVLFLESDDFISIKPNTSIRITTSNSYLLTYRVKSFDIIKRSEIAEAFSSRDCNSWLFIVVHEGSRTRLIEAELDDSSILVGE